uniref:Uncharacterized protein LOC102806947 n=1 Tax=Saccoglossus kowalevskii TaxID=10224 RepID=A0ABM0M6J7_SACKO|nr:PREDICTED: uncharacterized protein LOC102806947 [Saccoglossus kowalevskii]
MAGHTVSVMWVTEFLTLLILLVAIQVATRQQCGDGQFYRGEHFGCNPCKLCTSSDDIPGCEECYSRHCENGWFFHGKDYGCHPCSVCKTPDDLPGCDECDFSTSEPQTLTASDLKNDEAVISEVDDDVVNKDNRNSDGNPATVWVHITVAVGVALIGLMSALAVFALIHRRRRNT